MQRLPLFYCHTQKHGMKHSLSFLVVLLFLTACKKTTVSPPYPTETAGLTGMWSLVTDSTFKGVGTSNHPVDYTGEAGDYFDFDTNGCVYTRENTVLATLTYRLVSDTTIMISAFGVIVNGVPDTSTITGLSTSNGLNIAARTIVIESPFFPTPGGEFWRKVTLSR
jgi:hypothetical protein